MSSRKLLQVELRDNVALLLLDRAEKRNALNDQLIDELGTFFTSPPEGVAAIVLHGAGEHFCAGLDLVEMLEKRKPGANGIVRQRRSRQWHRVFDLMQFGEVPIVSVLKGGVIGGGMEIAAATHVRVVERSTFFQLPEGQRGIFLGGGGSVRIPRIIGGGRVVEMMLTGRTYDAEQGMQLGLGHHLVDNGAGLDRALELAATIASNAATSNYAVINGIARIAEMGHGEGLFTETMVASLTGSDSAERINGFLEGRRKARTGSAGS
ncbi:MAG: enoyl-CoA hydratase [Ramlibacter sp.]|jgi:enoyl-CoA hydratase/carnithine racemase|nr:enoyl-CoA hydratase [Ramlibacter sp.]